MQHKSYFLSVGRQLDVIGTRVLDLSYQFLALVVSHNLYGSLLGLFSLTYGVYFAVVAIAQGAVSSDREEAYGILLVVGDACLLAVESAAVDVECAVLFAQIVERLAVGSPYRVAVFAVECGQPLKLLSAFEPDVASDRRAVMFAPFVLISLAVHIEHVARGVDVERVHSYLRVHLRASSVYSY